MPNQLPDTAPEKIKQNKNYVAMESLATVLVIVGAILAGKGGHGGLVAILFVIAALLFLVAALMNISTLRAQNKQMDTLKAEEEKRTDPSAASSAESSEEDKAEEGKDAETSSADNDPE